MVAFCGHLLVADFLNNNIVLSKRLEQRSLF